MEVIRRAYEGGLENVYTIPRTIAPGPKPDTRCCIHKERAVLMDRVHMVMGGNKDNPNVVFNIDTDDEPVPEGELKDTPGIILVE